MIEGSAEARIVAIKILNVQMYTMDEVKVEQDAVQPTRRRRRGKEFKEQVIRAGMQPNVSVAVVALHYCQNANILRRWVPAQEERDAADAARKSLNAVEAELVPLQLEAPNVTQGSTEIQIEVGRGAATVTVR